MLGLLVLHHLLGEVVRVLQLQELVLVRHHVHREDELVVLLPLLLSQVGTLQLRVDPQLVDLGPLLLRDVLDIGLVDAFHF
jgi:hypothetical protein